MNPIKLCMLAISLLLAGCSTGYQASGTYAEFPVGGYADSRINGNTAVVSFDGNQYTDHAKVENYLLYRSAQVTLANGYDYFIITSKSTSPVNVQLATRTSYNGYVSNPPKLYDTYSTTTSLTAYRASESQVRTCDQHKAVAVIKMFKGRPPTGLSRAYSAEDIIAHVGPSTL